MSYFTQDGTVNSCGSDRHGKVPYIMSCARTMNPQNCHGARGAISFCCAVSDHVAALGAISVGRHRLSACFSHLCWRAQQCFGCVLDVRGGG